MREYDRPAVLLRSGLQACEECLETARAKGWIRGGIVGVCLDQQEQPLRIGRGREDLVQPCQRGCLTPFEFGDAIGPRRTAAVGRSDAHPGLEIVVAAHHVDGGEHHALFREHHVFDELGVGAALTL